MATRRTKRPQDDWAHAELDSAIAQARKAGAWSNEATVLICDPSCREEIVSWINERIWPGVLRMFNGTELVPDPASADGQPQIRQEWMVETSMSFVFLVRSLEDAGVEIGENPYFCRIATQCRLRSFFIQTDFYLHFPESIDMARLKALLGNPKFVGNPPKLSYETGHGDHPGILIVGFNFGSGCGYEGMLPLETMLAELAEHVNYLRRLIRAVRQLSTDYDSEPHLRAVVRELEKCFPAE